MIKSPHPTKIEKGAYSAIIFKDGNLAVAEDNVGTVISENSNAATVIQAAIDSCDGKGEVVLTDTFDTTATITLPSASWPTFTKGITFRGLGLKSGINYTPVTGYAIKLEGTAGDSQCAHHLLDDLTIKAPNTTDAVIGILGGVVLSDLRSLRIVNCPSGKGVYIYHSATFGGNIVHMSDVTIYNCKYGVYASGGPSLSIDGRSYFTTLTAGGGQEALYYTVDGYTGSGFKQLHTENLEICTETADQRSMYVKGDKYLYSSHHNLYDDVARPIYLDSGRHAFYGCYLGELDWSIGTQVTIDQASRGIEIEGKDPMFGFTELQTPFRIDSNSPFLNLTGTKVADSSAANGYCMQLDAQNEQCALAYKKDWGCWKGIGRGKYLLTIYAKDTTHVAGDMKVQVQADEGGTHFINIQNLTLAAAYNAVPYSFTLAAADVGTTVIITILKGTATTNTISIDYMTLQHVATDYHHSLGGGHQFLYIPDGGLLPSASATFRGIIAFQPKGSGVADALHMCMKSAANTYSWKTIVTG